jgi:coenzyme F420-reducing hydrogenase alpha subunit
MLHPLSEENRTALLRWIPEATQTTLEGLKILRNFASSKPDDIQHFDNFPTSYLGTVTPDGSHELYDGNLRFTAADGSTLADQVNPANYLDYIASNTPTTNPSAPKKAPTASAPSPASIPPTA